MGLRADIEWLLKSWKQHESTLDHNKVLFDIYEGNLLNYVLEDLQKQLSPQSYEQVKHRVPPINVLVSIVGKLSQIYNEPPIREIVDGNVESDGKALTKLVETMDYNTEMSVANEFFNLFKCTFIEPYLDDGKPALRSVPADRFIVLSKGSANTTKPTHYMKYMGKNTNNKDVFHAYTKDEFLIFNEDKEVDVAAMIALQNPLGKNLFGALPGVYINRSRHNITPTPDSDTMTMSRLVPTLLADLNFAVMFQSFSIVYGIDVDDSNLVRSPNAFWRFKTNPNNPDAKPEVGVIKPEVDTDKALTLVKTLMAMWMETRNIKPGSVGDMTVGNASSGIAKMIDEADTSKDRTKQIKFFSPADSGLLELIVNHMHPLWMKDPAYTFRETFSSDKIKILSRFPEQKPILDPSKQLDDEIKKLGANLTTPNRALKVLNPDMNDDAVKKLEAEIAEFKAKKVKDAQDAMGGEGEETEQPPKPPGEEVA